jgi:hypothetical protein
MNTDYEPVPLTRDTINEDGVAYALYQEPLTEEWFVELIDLSNRGVDGYVVTLLDEERLYSSWHAAHTAAYHLTTEFVYT